MVHLGGLGMNLSKMVTLLTLSTLLLSFAHAEVPANKVIFKAKKFAVKTEDIANFFRYSIAGGYRSDVNIESISLWDAKLWAFGYEVQNKVGGMLGMSGHAKTDDSARMTYKVAHVVLTARKRTDLLA